MAKKRTSMVVRLMSQAGTGYFYTIRRAIKANQEKCAPCTSSADAMKERTGVSGRMSFCCCCSHCCRRCCGIDLLYSSVFSPTHVHFADFSSSSMTLA